MTWPGIEPRSPGPMTNTIVTIYHHDVERNITQRGTQAWVSLLAGALPIANMRQPIVILQMFGVLFSGSQMTRKPKTRTRENNKLKIQCYFRSNPTQRGYRIRMIEILQECASFQTTSQKLADQVRKIIKNGWFSDLEILKIH